MKILIVDDHPIVREALKLALSVLTHSKLHFSESTREAISSLEQKQFDLLILDHELSDGKGFEVLQKARKADPKLPVVIFSQTRESVILQQYQSLNVNAILHKSTSLNDIRQTILDIIAGKPASSTALQTDPSSDVSLTARELEVVRSLVKGKSNKEICSDLDCSEGTIKTHKANIMRKLGVNSSVDVCVWAMKNKIV